MLCFFNLISCSFTQGLYFIALNIKSFNDSQTIHLAKTNPFFCTSTFRFFFFFNSLIVDCKILPICNSLLIYKCEEKPNIIMINKNIKYLFPLQLRPCSSLDLVATRLKNGQDIIILQDSMNNQLINNA
jgi:hypothetical protein